MTSNNRWFSREACDRWWGVRMLGAIHHEKFRKKAVRCTAHGKGFLFFLQIHITGGFARLPHDAFSCPLFNRLKNSGDIEQSGILRYPLYTLTRWHVWHALRARKGSLTGSVARWPSALD